MKLVGPSQSHFQANGSLRMICRLSQVSILYIIALLLFYINITILLLKFLFDTVLFNSSKEIKLMAHNLVSFPDSYGAWHALKQGLARVWPVLSAAYEFSNRRHIVWK